MSSDTPTLDLTKSDLEMLRRVLDDAALETGRRNVSALLIIRLFQSGMRSPADLAKALHRCIPCDLEISSRLVGHLTFGLPLAKPVSRTRSLH